MNTEFNFKKVFNLYRRIYLLLSKIDKRVLYLIIFNQIIMGVIPSLRVILIKYILNGIQKPSFSLSKIYVFVMIYITMEICNDSMNKIISYITFKFKNKVVLKLNLLVLNKTSELNLKNFENTDVYNMIQRAQGQANESVFNYFMSLISLVSSIIAMATNIGILLAWRWWLLIIIVLISIFKTIVMVHYSKKQYELIRNRTTEERKKWYYQFLLTNDLAFKEIKMYKLFNYFIHKFKIIYDKFFEQDRKNNKSMSIADGVITLIDDLCLGGIFILSILDAKYGRIMIGDAIAYITSISNIKSSIESFSGGFLLVVEQTLYISQIFEFIDMDIDSNNDNDKKITINKINSIKIDNLSYKYENSDHYVLKNINLTLLEGDIISLVGRNGSGKSTLVKIIAGFYNNYEGNIFINDINLKLIDIESYQKAIGILFQDYTQYELSLRENVAVGNLDYVDSDKKIENALSLTGMDKVFSLETQLGYWFENGTQLSGGQWIKVALSRTFLRNSDLYILDEPNASLDGISEKEIFENYKLLVRKKIGLIVTHRLSSARFLSDKIVLLDKGEIISTGSHNELLKKSAVYRGMYDLEYEKSTNNKVMDLNELKRSSATGTTDKITSN
ncbi:ABC transporter family protein [Clostridium sporogenes]|uniref:ABC transporter family protein n=1 Tax=Clostridium sporogenes TaxID=1509 RepID=A0A1L3ND76_CLOSG|nr:ABC transporter ATP-binding protein [Clostridium sporogenes]APH14080.1 ABC transporter family protein [Clostridium sporogenes]